MKKALSAIAVSILSGLLISANAQNGNDFRDPRIQADLQENIFRAGVNTNPYEFHPVKETPVPKGYKPFYISHYGRHGARSDWARYGYADVRDQLARARDEGILTPDGVVALERIEEVIRNHNGNDGRLTRLGTQEHRQIAGRMYDRYRKTVFGRKAPKKVRAVSSTVQRCIVSMTAFTGELISRDPSLDLWWDTGESFMPVCSTSDSERIYVGAKRLIAEYEKGRHLDTAAFVKRVFTDRQEAIRITGGIEKLMRKTLYAATGCAAFGMDDFLLRLFTEDDIYQYAEDRILNLYMRQCNSTTYGDERMIPVEALVDDIIRKADEVIADGGCAADLRFGHDYQLLAIASRLGLSGVGERRSLEESRSWRGYLYTPFACNLQMVFFRDKKNDVLVKFFLNESETTSLLLEGGPYYRWEDFKRAVKYRPNMLGMEFAVKADCHEVSGLSLSPDGDGWLAASDENGVWHISSTGAATPVYVTTDPLDCEGVTVDPQTKDIYFVVEGDQELRRLPAPDYGTPELVHTVSDIGKGTNRGLEGVTWYGDGTIFLGNQRKPNALIKYSVTEGRELERIDIKATSEVADLYYDPLTGFLWILDSELFTLNLCNTRGELVKSYSVKGIANPEALCVDHANNCIWLGDDETSNIYKITFDSL